MNPLLFFEGNDIDVDEVPAPGGLYQSINIRGNVAYVSIQFPIEKQKFLYTGQLGKEVSSNDGYQASRLCAINILRQVNKYVGFENIIGLNHIEICYQAIDDWDDGPLVADGASILFQEALGVAGRHSRSIYAVQKLPRNLTIGITSSFTLNQKRRDM